MLHENFSFGMNYKEDFIDKTLREQQNYFFTNSFNLTIEIDIDQDIQDLKKAIDDCLNHPDLELSWSKLDDLFNQQGLSKYLTKEQSMSIIGVYFEYMKGQSLESESALCVIKTCLGKFSSYVQPEIIDFIFQYAISHICENKISTVKESFNIIFIILPFTAENQRLFFIDYISKIYSQICLMNNYPHSAFLVCIGTFFKFCSFNEVVPSFQKLNQIIFQFLPCTQWGLSYDAIKIIKAALKKDPNVCNLLLDPKNNFIKNLTKLVSQKKESITKNALDLCTLIINSNLITSGESLFLKDDDINDFIGKVLESIPTAFEKLEISIVQFIAEALKNGLNPSLINVNIFDLVQKPIKMKFKQKKAILSFACAALQVAPQLFIHQFIESNDGEMVELTFELTDNNDEKVLLDALNIILIVLDYRQTYMEGARYSEFVNQFLSTVDIDIDFLLIKMVENDEIQRLASLIEEKNQIKEV